MDSVAVVIAIVLAGIGVGYAMNRASSVRKELADVAEQKPPRQSKRQRRLEQIRAAEPEFTPPSIEDLIDAEIADAGIDQIQGAAGIPPAVLLKTYRRDEDVARKCPTGKLQFVIAEGVDAAAAEVEDVALRCDASPGPDSPLPEAENGEDSED